MVVRRWFLDMRRYKRGRISCTKTNKASLVCQVNSYPFLARPVGVIHAPLLQHANQNDHDSDHQQDVNESAGRISGSKAEGPQDE